MARKTKDELNQLKKDNNVSELWSWSKYHKACEDLYGYYLRYIKGIKEDSPNCIYGKAGNCVHDLMEKYYLGKINEKDMVEEYIDKMNEFDTLEYKFDRNNEDSNNNIKCNYNACNEHFLRHFQPINIGENISNVELEKFLTIKVSKFLFQGYSDYTHDEVIDGVQKRIITDFKTSTIYKGKKIEKERGQLLLYALGEIQNGWDAENIMIRWLFTKYANVSVPHKDGFKVRQIERNQIGSKLTASVKVTFKKVKKYSKTEIESMVDDVLKTKSIKDLPNDIQLELGEIQLKKDGEFKKSYINKITKTLENKGKYNEDEIDGYLSTLELMNSLDMLPDDVKSQYKFENCFVYIDFTKEDIKNLQIEIVKKIFEVKKKQIEYNRDKDDKIWYNVIDKENSYFFSTLSGYSRQLHKPYNEYLKTLNEGKCNKRNDSKDVEEDLSWLNDI